MLKKLHITHILTGFVFLFTSALAMAENVHVAVAANFVEPLKAITASFERSTGHKVTITGGSTGKIYTQIKNGAPYDLFLAADSKTPAKLEQENDIVAGSRFTYAIGKLALWSAQPNYVDSHGAVLKKQPFNHIAIAAPKLAPYGLAAMQTLDKMGLTSALEGKIVTGENIGQTHQFVASGNAEVGFVALSQIYKNGRITSGSAWIVNPSYYQPIKQDAVMLPKAANNKAAKALMKYLKGTQAKSIMKSFGYAY